MKALATRWNEFLFEPRSARDLGICRFLFFSLVFIMVLPADYSVWPSLSPIWRTPLQMFHLVPLPLFSSEVVAVMQVVWKVSLVMAAVGLLARFSVVTATVLGFYLLLLDQSVAKIHQHTAILGLTMIVLSTSRCCDAFTLDRILWKGRAATREPRAGEAYGWPGKMVLVFLSTGYFLAGYSKIATSGLAWIFSDNFKNILIESRYGFSSSPPVTDWGGYVAGMGPLCICLAAATIIGEMLYPLALFSRRLRWVLVPSALLAHMLILLLVGPRFFTFMIVSLFWVRWDAVEDRLRRAVPA